MSDLQNFMAMISKGCQNYAIDEFYSMTRVQVKNYKFKNWMGLITGQNSGVPFTMIYVFDKEGSFVSSAMSL
jgi:hypothetical protein